MTSKDISKSAQELERVSQELHKSEDRYWSFVTNFQGITYRAKMDFIPIFIHGAVQEITGYSEKEFCSGKPRWDQIIHPDDLASLFTEDEKKLHTICVHSYEREYRIIHKQGHEIWVSEQIQNICDDAGKPVELQGVILDITKRKTAERQQQMAYEKIQETQKLESLGVLAGGIAHDFNNLLVGVLGNAEMALLDMKSDSPARTYIQNIQTASIRLSELTNQMLAYSGKGKFVIGLYNLSSLIQEMIQLLKHSIDKKLEIRLELDKTLPAIRGDASQLRQVVMNLITNAAEACRNKPGFISVVTGVRYVDRSSLQEYFLFEEMSEGDYVFFEVSDTGCGMNKQTRLRVFEPFFSTKCTGRGLGMAAVLGIIRSHKGAIQIRSEPGKGTIVNILFPFEEDGKVQEFRSIDPTKSHPLGKKGLVLLVDDDDTIQSVGRMMLERMGYDVISARDGIEAVTEVREHASALVCVLLDYTMPQMNGLEAFEQIRQICPSLPVILCSGYQQDQIISQVTAKDNSEFLQKPYHYHQLIDALQKVLES